jgi:WD40 repeat protein
VTTLCVLETAYSPANVMNSHREESVGNGSHPGELVRPRVFISYARADGEDFTRRLRERLEVEEPEITVWQDRAHMQGGRGWRVQIEEALDQVEFSIMIMTPGALRSEECRREWRYARQRGVVVCPIMADREITRTPEFQALPRSMRKAHWYDLEREWETFCRSLKSPPERRRVPFMAPELTSHFTARPIEFSRLIELLLAPTADRAAAISTTLHGAGGYGKTTLAIAVCHDERVLECYDDGVLWVTLGQTPNLLRELTKVYEAVTGQRPEFIDVEEGSRKLAERLATRNYLLVVDDVWHRDHLAPFARSASGTCAYLLTTRNASIAERSERVDVDAMRGSESLALLTTRLQSWQPEVKAQRERLARLAEQLLHWPLLIKLVGSQLRARMERNDSLPNAISHVERALSKRGLTAFDSHNATQRSDAVRATLGASLAELRAGQIERLRELAIFPEDINIPLAVIARYWSMDELDTEDLVVRLDESSLLDLDLGKAALRLHDEVRWYLGDEIARENRHTACHERLIATLPRDPTGAQSDAAAHYSLCHLVHHLLAAERSADIRALLLDFRWISAKVRLLGVQSLLADFDKLPITIADEPAIQSLNGALQMSAHVLARSPDQFASQLLGRLPVGLAPELDEIRDRASSWRGETWLRPLLPQLHPPRALLRTIEAGYPLQGLALSGDGEKVVAGVPSANFGTLCRVWHPKTGQPLSDDSTDEMEFYSWGGEFNIEINSDGTRILSSLGNYISRAALHAVRDSRLIRIPIPGDDDGSNSAIATFSVDGRHFFSANRYGLVAICDAETGTTKCALPDGRVREPRCLVVSPDGRYVALTDITSIRIWHVKNEIGLPVVISESGVHCLAFSPDSSQLVSGGDDKLLKLWHSESGEPIGAPFSGHESEVMSVAFNATGTRIASRGMKSDVFWLWDAETHRPLEFPFCRHDAAVTHIAFSRDGTRIVSCSEDQSLQLWEAETGLAIGEPLLAHTDRVTAAAFTPDDTRIVSASIDRTLRIWDVNRIVASTQESARRDIISAALSKDAERFVVGDSQRSLQLWDLKSLRPLAPPVHGHKGRVTCVAYSHDGTRIVSGGADQTLRIWDATSGRPMSAPLKGHKREPSEVGFNRDGTRIFSRDQRTARLWNAESGAQIGDPLWRTQAAYARVEFSLDGERFIFEDSSGVVLADLRDGQQIAKLAGVGVLTQFSPDSKLVAVSGEAGIELFDANTGKALGTTLRVGDYGYATTSAFSMDGKRIAATTGGIVQVWDMCTAAPIGPLIDLPFTASFIALDSTGLRMLVLSGNHNLRLYDCASGEVIGIPIILNIALSGSVFVATADFSPNGRHFVVTDYTQTLRVYSTDKCKLVATIDLDTRIVGVMWREGLVAAQDTNGIQHLFRLVQPD